MTNSGEAILDTLIAQVADQNLRTALQTEMAKVWEQRRFGLVFDRMSPEAVRLPNHPVRRHSTVALRDESSTQTFLVDSFTDRTRQIARLLSVDSQDGTIVEKPVEDLVVVRRFGEAIYPGLEPAPVPAGRHGVKDASHLLANGGSDAPWHTVIQGENFHALQALTSTHHGSVDCIYIDPPYNTGGQSWIYNDRFVDPDKSRAASSTWLSFMERRLVEAKKLLKPTGVIIVAIGDDEHHRLRMLMDQVFGRENFIANVTWQGGGSSLSRFTSGGVDYMVAFARDIEAHAVQSSGWIDAKAGAPELLSAARRFHSDTGGDATEATTLLRSWIREQRSFATGLAMYDKVDDLGRAYATDNLANGSPRPNLQYEVLHPLTGEPVKMHPNGWRWAKERMDQAIADGLVVFGADHTTTIRQKRFLDEFVGQLPAPTFSQVRTGGSNHVADVLGDKRFPFPKDHTVLARWIRMAAPKDAVVLDFFGGSGSTLEAVLRLNAEDGGTRQCILVTNNEVGSKEAKAMRAKGLAPGDDDWESKGVFEYVTRPRIATVVTGTREDDSKYSAGIAANVAFHKLAYLDPGMVRAGAEYAAIAPLLWMQAGGVGPVIDEVDLVNGYRVTGSYGVLFDTDARRSFAADVNKTGARTAFIVTDSDEAYAAATGLIGTGVTTHRLYESYLTNFECNTEGDN